MGGRDAQEENRSVPPPVPRQTHRGHFPEATLPAERGQAEEGQTGKTHASTCP